MTVWSQERVVKESGRGLVDTFDETKMENGAYALTVAAEYAITTANGGGEKRTATNGEHINIPPGQFALLLSNETVAIPDNALGLISIKSKLKLRGLVNVSGFHVDPGFSGRLKFSVYNAGNQNLDLAPGQRLFLLWYNELDQPTKHLYNGSKQGQSGITPDDVASIRGLIGSPAGLYARIDSLDERLTTELEKMRHHADRGAFGGALLSVMMALLLVLVTATLVLMLVKA